MADVITVAPSPDGIITVADLSDGPAPAGFAFVPLEGVTLLVDPTATNRVPRATVYDPAAAAEVVAALYGDEAAEALERPDVVGVHLTDSPARALAWHLGVVRWLQDNRPLPVDAALLDLEAAVAKSELPGDVDDDDLADDDRVATLTEMARRLRSDPGLPLAADLVGLFRRAAATVPRNDHDPVLAAFAHERELLDAGERFGSTLLTEADLEWLTREMNPVAANHLGEVNAPRAASIDWMRVPSAMLPAAEDSVTFRLPGADGSEVVVHVAAAPRARPHPAVPRTSELPVPVVASLRSLTWPVPLASGPLARQADGTWLGRLPITSDALDLARSARKLDVDVRGAHVPWSAPNRRRYREAAAQRWASRGWALRRLGILRPDAEVAAAASRSLGYAARLWAPTDAVAAAKCRSLVSAPLAGEATLAEQWLLASKPGTH